MGRALRSDTRLPRRRPSDCDARLVGGGILFPLMALGLGVAVGVTGWEYRTEPLGAVGLGAGGSLVAAGLLLLATEIL